MPQGYYTIEQWKPPKWVAVAVLPFGLSLTEAERALVWASLASYRLVQTHAALSGARRMVLRGIP